MRFLKKFNISLPLRKLRSVFNKWTNALLATITVLFLAVSTILFTAAFQSEKGPPPIAAHFATTTSSTPTTVQSSTTSTLPQPKYLARSIPLFIDIPSINLSANLTQLGLNPDGTVQVPSSWNIPGWYRFGATPGQQGSAVILGHVDSVEGPAVFYSISKLSLGDIVSVGLSDGIVTHFSVTNVEMFQKSNFPDNSVYGNNGSSDLNLVTCGGAFDYQSHHYLSNVVVYTTYIGSSIGK